MNWPLVLPVAAAREVDGVPVQAVDAETALSLRPESGVAIVCLLTKDVTLERIWRQRSRLGKDLATAHVLAIAPAFSTWTQDPPFEGVHAMSRTAHLAIMLANRVPTIPAIAWRVFDDFQRWADWFALCPPPAVAIDVSTLKDRRSWRWALASVTRFADQLGVRNLNPRLIVVGPFAFDRIRDVATAWPHELTIASRGVWHTSRAGMILNAAGRPKRAIDVAFPERLAENLISMELQVMEVRGSCHGAALAS